MGIILWRAQTVAISLIDLSNYVLLALSKGLHSCEARSVGIDSEASHARVREQTQPIHDEVQPQEYHKEATALSTSHILSSSSPSTGTDSDPLSPVTTARTIPTRRDIPRAQQSEFLEDFKKRKGRNPPKYPPELKCFYRETKMHMKRMKLAKELRQRPSSDTTVPLARHASPSSPSRAQRRQKVLAGPTLLYNKAKICPEAFDDGAVTTALVNRSTRTDKDGIPTRDRNSSNNSDVDTKISNTIPDGYPSTPASRLPQTGISPLISCYPKHIRDLQGCRKALNARIRERSQAEVSCHKADMTLQCIIRNDMCATNFWRKYQRASEVVFEKTVREFRKARGLEAKLVKIV